MITLYNIPLSGNCHKVRLMLSFLNLAYATHELNLAEQEHKQEAYLCLHPLGQAPVLKDNRHVIRDSQAILIYLASKYGNKHWWPDNALELAQIVGWLSIAANEIAQGPANIRAHVKFSRSIDMALAQQTTDKILQMIDRELQNRIWLIGDKLTIADIAVYPYIALAHEGHIELTSYKNIQAWLLRFQALSGFIPMPGIHTNHSH